MICGKKLKLKKKSLRVLGGFYNAEQVFRR
jgi:hypothetical protein